jgi:hypothetical protein
MLQYVYIKLELVGFNLPPCRHVLAAALKEMNAAENITAAPRDCSSSGVTWETGKKLFE